MTALSFDTPVLALEASTTCGSVALWRDGALVDAVTVSLGAGRSDVLFPAVQQLLAAAALSARELNAIVCGAGPGSFTSLRIAAALAKGLTHGVGCPLFAVPSLLVAAAGAREAHAERFVVHADALRGERYVLPVVRLGIDRVAPAGPVARITASALQDEVPAERRVAVLASTLADERVVVAPDVSTLMLCDGAWRSAPVSLADWEPAYGRLAEAQVKWEAQHGVALPAAPAVRA